MSRIFSVKIVICISFEIITETSKFITYENLKNSIKLRTHTRIVLSLNKLIFSPLKFLYTPWNCSGVCLFVCLFLFYLLFNVDIQNYDILISLVTITILCRHFAVSSHTQEISLFLQYKSIDWSLCNRQHCKVKG